MGGREKESVTSFIFKMRDVHPLMHKLRKIRRLLCCECSSLRWKAAFKQGDAMDAFLPPLPPLPSLLSSPPPSPLPVLPCSPVRLFPFVTDATDGIELSRKVFIRYDPIIHGAAATTVPAPFASLLITGVPGFFKCIRRHGDTSTHACIYILTCTRAHALSTTHWRSQPAGRPAQIRN